MLRAVFLFSKSLTLLCPCSHWCSCRAAAALHPDQAEDSQLCSGLPSWGVQSPRSQPPAPGTAQPPSPSSPWRAHPPQENSLLSPGVSAWGTSGTSGSRAAGRCKQPRARARACPPAAAPGSVYGGTYAVQWVCSACGVSHCCQAQCPFLVPKSGTIPCKWAQIHPKTQTKEEVAQSSLVWAPRDSCIGRDFTRARRISV